MTMLEAYKICIKKYVKFDGRARRKEYWYFTIFNSLIMVVLTIPSLLFSASSDGQTVGILFSVLIGLYNLFIFLPGLAVTIRRLHDVGRSGAAIFISLIPAVGEIILFIWLIEEGNYGTNQYGPNPKEISPAPVPSPAPRSVPAPSPVHTPAPVPSTASALDQPRGINVVCVSGNMAGKSVSGSTVSIGRDPGRCQLVFPEKEPGVSRLHCMVLQKGNAIELVDLNSSNGTFLSNGYRLTPNVPVALRNGDSFYVGSPANTISVRTK